MWKKFVSFLAVALFVTPSALAEQRHLPFTDSGAPPERQYGRAVAFDVLHSRIEVSVDLEHERVAGRVTHTLSAIGEARHVAELDAVGLQIEQVSVGGSEVAFEYDGEKLRVYFPEAAAPGEAHELSVSYSVVRPKRGMHFRTKRMGYAPQEVQAWTQGQSEDTRYWLPIYDYPNERMTTEVLATVPSGFRALSNGTQIEKRDNGDGTSTWHWRMKEPHVAYLISLVVGQFVEMVDDGPVPNYYYVLPGQENAARNAFGATPEMLAHFQELLRAPYPYERYSQVAVADFIAGGMENTTISTMMDTTLHDDAAHLTYSSDWLVAHELAHQWFGNLLTCRDWSQLWLNEGFASFFEVLWAEHTAGPLAAEYDLWQKARDAVGVDKGDQPQPVIRHRYGDEEALFDARVYDKGAWVLHMLRRHLGDERFFACLAEYVDRFRNKSVETRDFLRTCESITGESLEQFFEQWLNRPGTPDLSVEYAWQPETGTARVKVRQTQPVEESQRPYLLRTALRFALDGRLHDEPIELREVEHVFHVPLPQRPDYVRLDPHYAILGTVDFHRGSEMARAILEQDESFVGRLEALEELAEQENDDNIAAIRQLVLSDEQWPIRAQAAMALAQFESDAALEALREAAGEDEARVRLAVAEALGKFRAPTASETLKRLAAEDPSPYVCARAIASLGDARSAGTAQLMLDALKRDAHNEVIRRAALDALVKTGDARHLSAILPMLGPLTPRRARYAAISAAGALGFHAQDKARARQAIEGLLDDGNQRVRRAALGALESLGDERAIPTLEAHARTSRDESEAEAARAAADALRDRETAPAALRELREELTELKDSRETVDERLDALEEKLDAILQRLDVGEQEP